MAKGGLVIKFGELAGVSALLYTLLPILRIKRRTKRARSFKYYKCKREGYALFRASHVQDVKYNFSSHSEFCFFETKVKASMTRNKTYGAKVRLKKNTAEVDGAY